MAAKKKSSRAKKKKTKGQRRRRSVDERIDELKRKLVELEHRKAIRAIAREPVYRHLRLTRTALRKAVEVMDGRTNSLNSDFIRASRQYLNLIERALDEVTGKKRRGRKPKADLG